MLGKVIDIIDNKAVCAKANYPIMPDKVEIRSNSLLIFRCVI